MKSLVIRLYGFYLNVMAIVAPASAAKKGFLIFCRPIRVKTSLKQKHFFNSADRFELRIENEVIQGYRWGNGNKKILFLHGWQSHTYRWKPYVEALQNDDFTIYSFDAPGHGLSSGNFLSVPVYSAVIENFIRETGDFHAVVGHSLGGFSLLYTLHRFPLLQIDQVVLLAPPGEASEFISVFQKTLGLNAKTVNLVIDEFVNRYNVAPEYFSTTRFAKSLNVPGIIIHDEEDNEAPYRYSTQLHQNWNRSKLVTTRGMGHNLRSPAVVKEVVNFINGSDSFKDTSKVLSSQLEKL
jgi:pimeloyl-ACP methyl ester carboxylesterase